MLRILLMPCIFVYNIFKFFGKGIGIFFDLITGKSNKRKNKSIASEKKDSVKVIKPIKELTASQLEKQRKKDLKYRERLAKKQQILEKKIIEHERAIEIEKQKQLKKLEEQREKQIKEQQEKIARNEALTKKQLEKNLTKQEQLRIKREQELERKNAKNEVARIKREQKLAAKIKRAEDKAQKKAELKEQLRIKNSDKNEKQSEFRQLKETAEMEKRAKEQEIIQIKEQQQEIERQNKINDIREQERTKEQETYEFAKTKKEKKEIAKRKKEEKQEEKKKRIEEKKAAKLAMKKAKIKKENDVNSNNYINENISIEKPNPFVEFFKSFKKIEQLPKKISDRIKNNSFAKNSRNKKDINRQALLIDFEGDEAKKSDVKLVYEYEAKDKNGKFVKGTFEAFSRVEVHSFLLSEGYEVYSIKTNKWINLMYGKGNVNKVKFKNKDLIFFLSQLSTYLRAGITLVEALRILSRQFGKKKKYKKIFESIIYELTMGESFSSSLAKQNVAFPGILVNMVRTAEMTGELPEVLDDMVSYFSEIEETKRQFVNAMMYPSIVFVFAMGVSTFILMYVVPQFTEIYSSMDGVKVPAFTQAVLSVSAWLKQNIIFALLAIIAFITVYIMLYKHFKTFKTVNQWILMHIPVIGTTVIESEVATFTKTLSSLLAHNVPITECMEILNKITNNEIYKMLILDVVANLGKGGKISDAFEGHWAFPISAYEMICTGEATGELPEMLNKVSVYYQSIQKSSVLRIKTFIEPIVTVFLTIIVGTIVLAIVVPMFNMYQTVQDY